MPVIPIGAENDYVRQANRLFTALRQVDEGGFVRAYAHCPATEGMGLAVYNRMIRAAGFEVIALEA